MIYFKADIRNATAATDDALTTSSVGIPVSLSLASDFDGLAKTVVFKAGSVSVDIALIGDADSTTVPPDVLAEKGKYLTVGIYAADGNGTIVIPTIWATVGLVQEGAVPSGVDPSEPTPSWVAQVQSIASEASEDAASALEKATAVETAAENGEFDGQDGADGTDGTDGFSPIVSVTEITGGYRVSITDATGTHTFDVLNGINGTDGVDGFSPTVTVEEITGGHRVTITDIDGDHVFDVMDGQGGSGGGAVSSVNGQTGDVVLNADDVGALPDSTSIPTKTSDLTNDSGFITSAPVQSVNGKTGTVMLTASDVGAKPSSYTAPVDSVNGKTGVVVLTASDVGAGTYTKPSGGIPASDLAPGVIPSVPVQSVNGKTGAVVLDAEDVGALPDDTPIPSKTSDLTNDSGFVNASGAASAAPVQSINGKTGAVTLNASDVGAGTYSKPSGGVPKTDLASDVQTSLGKADTALQQHQSLSGYATESWVQQQGYLTQHQSLSAYRTAAAQDVIDATKADKVTEVTVSAAGDVTQALDPGKLYHFTGALSSLTITLNAAASGETAQYHFDFDSGSTAPTVTLPGTVTMQGGTFTPEASKHYEVDILNGYGVFAAW